MMTDLKSYPVFLVPASSTDMSSERLGLCSPTPVMFDVSPEMQFYVSQEIQKLCSHKSIAATLTNPFSQILTKAGDRFTRSYPS